MFTELHLELVRLDRSLWKRGSVAADSRIRMMLMALGMDPYPVRCISSGRDPAPSQDELTSGRLDWNFRKERIAPSSAYKENEDVGRFTRTQ